MTRVSFIKWSRNCTTTIWSGVVVIPKYLKNACKAGYFNIFGYAKNTTSDSPRPILRPLYNRYFCQMKSGLRFALGPSESAFSRISCFWVELSCWNYSWLISAPKEPIKKHQPICLNDFNKYWHTLPVHVSCTRCHVFLLIIIFYKLVI